MYIYNCVCAICIYTYIHTERRNTLETETEEKTEIVYKKNQEQKWHWTKQQPWQLKDTVEKNAFKMLRGKLFSN